MASASRISFKLMSLSMLLVLTLGACATKRDGDFVSATERALVASLTALAVEDPSEVTVLGTPEPPDGSGDPTDAGIEITALEVENNYPDSITFYLSATSRVPIRRVVFFHWLQGQESRALERVDFEPGNEITASYTWETDRITVAPSSPIYFLWELEGESGDIFTTDEKLVYFDDLRFAWNEINDDEIVVRWYEGNHEFGEFIYATTREALDQMKAVTGADLAFPIFVLLYADFEDFASWHFHVEDWVGGQAFPPLGITAEIINSRDSTSWITDVIPHEVAHLFFYQQINTNLASWPSWMDEGFAQYFEFNSKNPALNRVERAAQNGELTPLRYIGGSFGHDPEEVRLAYDESLSVIVFLLKTWGESGLEALIDEIRAGATISAALSNAFGVTFEEFEAQWITWLGAPATPRPSPTALPTFGVIGAPAAETPSP